MTRKFQDSSFEEPDEAESSERDSTNSSVELVNKAVTAEGDQSVAIGEASNAVVNTGEVHGDIINISFAETPGKSTITGNYIDSALNLIKLTQSLSSELSRRIAHELEEARETFREGETAQSHEKVKAITQSDNWQALESSLKAMVMRALANMTLSIEGKDGIVEAEGYLVAASQFDSTCDVRTAHIRIKALREGLPAALADLTDPTSIDDFNLLVGMLIESGDVEAALKLVESPPQHISLDAESYRLKALASLLSRSIERAQEAKHEALKLMPKRQNIRIAAALIDYYMSLSPLALHTDNLLYPHPVNPALVKRDDESQKRLEQSAISFAKIAQEFQSGTTARKELETWRIACVANLSDATAEAVELCNEILTSDPTHFRVLAWVLQRRYDINLDRSKKALIAVLTENSVGDSDRLHYILALLGIHLREHATGAILTVLERERTSFERAGRLDLWRYWRGQALIDDNDPETALQQTNEVEDTTLRGMLKVLALCEIGNRNRNWSELISYLEAEWEQTKNPQFFIHLYEIRAQMGDAFYLADHAEDYCEMVGTASSVYLAVSGARSAQRNHLCLRLLEKYKHLFPASKLPEDLQRLRTYCKLETQDVKSALADMEKLVAENDSVENIVSLIDVLLAKGDLRGVETAARRLRTRDLQARQSLKLAEIIHNEDIELAKEFWRRGKDEAQKDPSLAPFAFMLAFKLGLDREIGSLWRSVNDIARSEDQIIQLRDMEQVLSQMREHQVGVEKIQELYGLGEAPLALVAERVKRPIIDIFNGLADENGSAAPSKWDARPRLFIRHGSRLLPPEEALKHSTDWSLSVDVTSLLLADHFGLLKKIEEAFRPLRISSKLPAALLSQRADLLDIQQTRLENCRAIIALVDAGKLRRLSAAAFEKDLSTLQEVVSTVTAFDDANDESEDANCERATPEKLAVQLGTDRIRMLGAALEHDGFAVGLLPLRSLVSTKLARLVLPYRLRNRIANCRVVLDSLRASDRISDTAFARALRDLGEEAKSNVSPISPLVGSKLFLTYGVADVLAGAGVLDRTCESFDVFITDDSIRDAQMTIEEYNRREVVAARAEQLLHRVNSGLEDGRYEFVSISDERSSETTEAETIDNLDLAASDELFRSQSNDRNVLWIDDRAINKYPFILRAPIIGIDEILAALRDRELIDKDEYHDVILKLRAQNFRYIPIDHEEIAYHLRRAPAKNGTLIETEALSILRRYVASCLSDITLLQPDILPGGARNRFAEGAFVTNCLISLNAAIAACWEDSVSVETARARADWILDNLYVGLTGTLHLQSRNVTGVLPFRLVARDIAGLLMNALKIGDPLDAERRSEQRAKYFEWLSVRVTQPRFRSEPRMLVATASEIERMFTLFVKKGQAAADGAVVERILLQWLFLDLPDELRDEIDLDNETREWLGVMTFSAAQVGGHTFDGREFVSAVESALAGKEAAITTQDGQQEMRFRIAEPKANESHTDIDPALAAFDKDNNEIAPLGDPMLKVLSPNPQTREHTLRLFRDWFDGSDQEFEATINEIARTDDAHERLERAKQLQIESSQAFYQRVEQRLRDRKLISDELMPRFVRILLNRFKLPPSFGGDFLDVWDAAAKKLTTDLGLETAIERCSCLPVRTPVAIVQAFSEMSKEERGSLINRLKHRLTSPIAKLHLLNLLLKVQGEAEMAEAKTTVAVLYDAAAEQVFVAFYAVLLFVHGELEGASDINDVSPQIRLALTWAHASVIYNIFHSLGFSSADISEMFRRHTEQRAAESILRESATWDDCLHPHRISRTVFLTHAVAKMLAGVERGRINEVGIAPLIEEKIVRDVNGTKIPDIPLLQDSALLKDGLNSIFGGDRAQALAILEDDAVELLSSENLTQIVEQSLDQILVDQNDLGWASMMFVLRDLAIYPSLRQKMQAAIMSLRIDEAFVGNKTVSQPALVTAANQVRHWGNEELRLIVHQKILATIKLESDRIPEANTASATTKDRRIIDFIDAALKCALVPGDLDKTGRNLATTLEQISEIWPAFAKRFAVTISAFVWELPIQVIVSLWPLLLKLRATMNEAI